MCRGPRTLGSTSRLAPAFARLARFACLACLACALVGCSHPPPDATPEGAVRLFLDDMDNGDDPTSVHKAYDLLGPVARANLAGRARRTSQLQGRQVHPWDMLAAGLFGLTFRPTAMHAAIVGDRAVVEVFGEDPQAAHASVSCVHEAGGWRIEPAFPEPT